jgi:soluble lytic murein transglycosylase-like protein
VEEVAAEDARLAAAAADAGTATSAGLARELTEDEIVRRYMKPANGGPAGKQTMMFRAAFQRVQKKSSRRYHVVIGAVVAALLSAGGVIAYQRQKLQALQATAERFFYAMKGFELRTGQLEELAVANADPAQVAALVDSRDKLKHMEREYDDFVRELGVYGRVPERQRFMLRVARRFGECEVNVPKEFVAEVERYIERWRGNDRLASALRRARQTGIGDAVTRTLAEGNLPPQFVYLALQESNFNDRAIGPPTRYGYAKGMWQFIAMTAHKYGLQVGPLYDQAVFDDRDDRFDPRRATGAAVKYIRELTTTEAQASGLLAMASYNWGEGNVRSIIAAMPENPQDRNFWRLLAHRNVPAETYDYVLSIFSAAVICENPAFFGFDVVCPIPPQPGIDERGRDRAG